MGHPRVKNKNRVRTHRFAGRVWVWPAGEKWHPRPHPSGRISTGKIAIPILALSTFQVAGRLVINVSREN
jgi:hypothetical protein